MIVVAVVNSIFRSRVPFDSSSLANYEIVIFNYNSICWIFIITTNVLFSHKVEKKYIIKMAKNKRLELKAMRTKLERARKKNNFGFTIFHSFIHSQFTKQI